MKPQPFSVGVFSCPIAPVPACSWGFLRKPADLAGQPFVTVPLAQHEYDALVSFSYNVGIRAFCQSTLVRKLNAGDYAGACAELLRWRFFQGKDCALPANARLYGGLGTRRQAEYRQCLGEVQ